MVKLLKISNRFINGTDISILSPTYPRFGDHCRKGCGKNGRAPGWGPELWHAVLWIWHGHCTHELTEAVGPRVRPAQEKVRQESSMDVGGAQEPISRWRLLRACGCWGQSHFSLGVWALVGCQDFSECPMFMCTWAAVIGLIESSQRRRDEVWRSWG